MSGSQNGPRRRNAFLRLRAEFFTPRVSTNVPLKFWEYFGQKLPCNWLFFSFFLLLFLLFAACSNGFVILYDCVPSVSTNFDHVEFGTFKS